MHDLDIVDKLLTKYSGSENDGQKSEEPRAIIAVSLSWLLKILFLYISLPKKTTTN